MIFIQKLFWHFPKRWPRMNTQRERKLGKFDSFTRLSFVWGTLLIDLKGFRTTWWKIKKKQGWVINKYKASNVDAKKFTWILCNIIDLLMVFTFVQRTSKMKSKIFTSVNWISFAEVFTNMTVKLFFYRRWGRRTFGTYTFSGHCPNAIWETYSAPHNQFLECLLVSLFSLAPPSC